MPSSLARSRPVGSRPTLPVSSPRSAFCSDSWNVRPIAITSPTDFICVVRRESACGNFSNAKRGILVRSEEHTSELQSLMRISYAVFCLKKKTQKNKLHHIVSFKIPITHHLTQTE